MRPSTKHFYRALVLDAESSAGLESTQSLGRHGVRVDVASLHDDCLAFSSHYVNDRFQQAAWGGTYFARWIQALQERNRYDLIVPSTEFSLLAMMDLEENSEPRRKAVLACNDSLHIALDKHGTWELASQLGILVPRTRLYQSLADIEAEPEYPVILKPAHSKIAVRGRVQHLAPELVKKREHWLALLESWLPHVAVQEQVYIAGKGVGVEFLFDHGRKLWHFAHERVHEYPLTGGCSTYRRSITASPALLDCAEKLMAALRWHGVAMVEFKLDDRGEYFLLEINPRLWGSLALAIDAGVDFPWGLLLMATRDTVPPQPRFKVPYYTRRLDLDIAWLKDNFVADHNDPFLHTRDRFLSLLEYLRPLVGRESWDHFDVHDLGVLWRILRETGAQAASFAFRLPRRELLKAKLRRRHRQLVRGKGQPKRLLFVCYGNICRSPLAEYLAKATLKNVETRSAGFYPVQGRSSPQKIVRAAEFLNLDLSTFSSNRISERDVEAADLILVMDLDNYAEMLAQFPSAIARTTALGLFCEKPSVTIPDPYYLSEDQTMAVVGRIEDAVSRLGQWLENKTCARASSGC